VIDTGICPSCGTVVGANRFCGGCGIDLTQPLSPHSRSLIARDNTHTLAARTVLAGRYEITAVIAVGSMGTVYAVRDLRSGNVARALKELLCVDVSPADQAEAESWFRREADVLRGLSHQAVPRIHDTFSAPNAHYLVMDLIPGATLEEVLLQSDGRMPREDQVLSWADQILDVLSYLHSLPQPLIFRDLKPANVMLTPEGQIRVIDFGIARLFSRKSTGTAIGTPGYAPPEQYQGLAEPASDFYALSATMHHLLTGRDPRTSMLFDFPPVRSLAPWVSPHVAAAVDRGLVLDARRRFDTAADMFRALHATTPLAKLPRLTLATTKVHPVTAGNAAPAYDAEVSVYVGPLTVAGGPDVAHLGVGQDRVTFGGVSLMISAGRTCLDLHNHGDFRLGCALISSIESLQPEMANVWLEPHGMVTVKLGAPTHALSIPRAGASAQANALAILAQPSIEAEDIPVALKVRGARPPEPFRPRMLPNIMPVAILAASNGGFALLAIGHILPLGAFFLYETPALILAMFVQRRARART
jgi:Protein kinase domain